MLDQVVSTGGPEGFHLWSLNGAGPLERVLPFTTARRDAIAANGGNIYTALFPDGSRLLTSVLALPDIVPSTNADLTSSVVTVEEFEPSIVQGFGPVTMQVTAAGFQLLDPALAPLGPPVPFPGPEFNWYGSPDGRYDAIEDAAGGVVDLYRATGELIASIESGRSMVCFSEDGQLLQVDETLWSMDPLERLGVDIVFDPDAFGRLIGDWILVKQEDGSLMRFDPLTQEPVGVALIGNPGGSGVYAYDSANGRLANLGERGSVPMMRYLGPSASGETITRPKRLPLVDPDRILATVEGVCQHPGRDVDARLRSWGG